MSKTVSVPSRLNGYSIERVLEACIGADDEPLDDFFIFDLRHVKFVEPDGIATLSNLLDWLKRRGCRRAVLNFENLNNPAIKYLDDSGFFALYLGRTLSPEARVRATTVPLQLVSHAESHAWLETNFVRWLADRLMVPMAATRNLNVCLKELFNNIQDHSSEMIGCMFVQHFPNKNQIVASISDFGIGIPGSLRRNFPQEPDVQLVRLATQRGVSSRSQPGNRGEGLYLLSQVAVELHRGSVVIFSKRGRYMRHWQNGQAREILSIPRAPFPGTCFVITIPTENFPVNAEDDDREDLEW